MNTASSTEKQKTIKIERTFALPLSTVWKAWSEPESFKKWWGPKEFTCPDCHIDFRVGGKILTAMQRANGKKIWSTGSFRDIQPQRKIVCTDSFSNSKGEVVSGAEYGMSQMPLELLITVELQERDGKTHLLLQHEGLPAELADDCVQGWQSSLDKLEVNLK